MINFLFVIGLVIVALIFVRFVIQSISRRSVFGRQVAEGSNGTALLKEVHGLDQDVWREIQRLTQANFAEVTSERSRICRMGTAIKQRWLRHRVHRVVCVRYLDTVTLDFYHYIIIFVGASVFGLIAEMIWMYITEGLVESRVGLVWGPFSPLYGFGAVLMTAVTWNFRCLPWYQTFGASAVIGGGLEQFTGMLMEHFLHASSWTYLSYPDSITQWIAWRFLVMWGVLGLAWCRVVMPELIYRIGEPSSKRQIIIVSILLIFIVADIVATMCCFYRKAQRDAGLPPQNPIDVQIDRQFSDRFIERRFQNLKMNR